MPVLAFGLLMVFVCKATLQQRLHLAFWLLDRWAACALHTRLPAEQLTSPFRVQIGHRPSLWAHLSFLSMF